MARRRVRAATRKQEDQDAYNVASGVYTIARDIRGQKLALPVFVMAPLVYVAEMIAGVICRRREWDRERTDQVALYVLHGLQEAAVALFERFDEQHFEAWSVAAQERDPV